MTTIDTLGEDLAAKLLRMLPHKTDRVFWTNSYTILRVASAVEHLKHAGVRTVVVNSIIENLDEVGKHFWRTNSKAPNVVKAAELLNDQALIDAVAARNKSAAPLPEAESVEPRVLLTLTQELATFDVDNAEINMPSKLIHRFIDLCLAYRPKDLGLNSNSSAIPAEMLAENNRVARTSPPNRPVI